MEEVRSYWQVASITHFCTLFQKPFKLPTFEPEELEQAFILNIPENPRRSLLSNGHDIIQTKPKNVKIDQADADDTSKSAHKGDHDEHYHQADDEHDDAHEPKSSSRATNSPDYQPPNHERFRIPQNNQTQQQQQQNDDQQELHLLVKLAIALLKPHFNSKISSLNWENYLDRLIEINWVELENCPSPFNVPIISPEGIELTKNLSFNELPLSDKIDIFSALCDYRFWCDDASELIKDYPVEELRLESIGKDQQGYEYWYFSGTRLFRENKELTQDLIFRKKRIKELQYKLVEIERAKILKEREEKRRAELERAKQLADEAKEAKLALKRQQEQDASTNARKKRGSVASNLPSRTGLRERRCSAASNNNEAEITPARTLRSRVAKPQPDDSPAPSTRKTSRSSRNSKQANQPDSSKASTPEPPRKSLEEECTEELEKLKISPEERLEAWRIECESLEEWENFATKYEKSKSTNEKYLSASINECILPTIRNIYAKRAAEIRRKERELIFSLANRRVSTRIISKRAQEEEEERQAQIREAEMQKKKAEAEVRLRAELEREMRAKKNRFIINGETSSACSEEGDENGRYSLRNQHDTNSCNEFDGIIHPDQLAEFYEALELIIDTVRTSKHAWPFVDPVPVTVPGYYDLIKEPTDLKKIRTKVEFREYKSLIELEKDFQLLINNCERFNGPRNVYTKMVYKLWKSFRKNVQIFLERDLHMNEYETFIYPPAPPQAPPPPPKIESHPEPQQAHLPAEQKPGNELDYTNKPLTENGTSKGTVNDDMDKNSQAPVAQNHHMARGDDGGHSGTNSHDEPHNRVVSDLEASAKKPQVTLDANQLNPKIQPLLMLEQKCDQPKLFKPVPHFLQPSLEVQIDQAGEQSEAPPEPIGEEVIIEMSGEHEINYLKRQDGSVVGQGSQ